MKKTIKQLALIAIVLLLVFSLAGCGNKLVATKTENEDGVKVDYKYVLQFKKDKLSDVEMIAEFEKEEDADEAMETFEMISSLMGSEENKIECKQSGKKITATLTPEFFANLTLQEEDLSKDTIKEALENEGFEVK